MSEKLSKTKEELRRYDIFKTIVAILIGILLLLTLLGGGEPEENAVVGSGADSTAESGAEEAADEPQQVVEISIPVLTAPEPGSELLSGPVPFSGSGTPGSLTAIVSAGQELGRTPVDENGSWELTVALDPAVEEIELHALDDAGNVAAKTAAIPFSVSDGQEEIAFTADPLPEAAGGIILLSGTGTPEYQVAVNLNEDEVATTDINEEGLWSVEISPGNETAEVTARLISPDGETVDTINVGEIEGPEMPVVFIQSIPNFNALTGDVALNGEAEPESQVVLLIDGEPAETVTADSQGQWSLNFELEPGVQEIAFGRLDEDGNVLSETEPITIEIPGELPRVALPESSLPDSLLILAGQAAGADSDNGGSESDITGDAADAVMEQERLLAGIDLDSIELPALLVPSGLIEWNGRAEPGSEIVFLIDGDEVDQTTANEEGGFIVNSDLTEEGEHTIQLAVPGEDGNLIAQSLEIPLSVADLELPTIELPESLGDGEGLTISGSAAAGETIEVTADGETVGETTANENGRWSLQLDSLPGASNLRAQLIGTNGNPLLQSTPLFLSGLGAQEITGGEGETPTEGEAVVSGTITYPEQETLPEDAMITVQIQDVSKQDVAAKVIGEQTIEAGGQQMPVPYEVAYDPANIDERFTYSMQVRIENNDGNLLFINDTSIPVITNDNPTENVEIPIIQVAAEESAPEEVEEASVTGTITYQEQIALPEDAVVNVRLQDISTPGAPTAVLGENSFETGGQQVPIPFDVSYNPADIVEDQTYSISVRIEDSADNLLFVNEAANPVITNGNPTEDIEVETTKVDTAVSGIVLGGGEEVIGEEGQSVIDTAESAGNFSTLLGGLEAVGLTETLQDSDGEYTLFAPTDEAFEAIPKELADAWDAYPDSYIDLMKHLVVEGKFSPDDLTDGLVLTSLAGKDIQIKRQGEVIYANGVPVLDHKEVGNSMVYATSQIILPLLSLNENLPIIDESGVPTFVGPLLTVVGLGEPGMEILLTVDGEKFGEIATIEPNGFWLVKENVESGIRYILAYMFDEDGILNGISQEVVLPVP
jgi:uncharacterized lipoprotein YbaY